jgi:hypothetical protein
MNTHLTDEERLAYLEGRATTSTTQHLDHCAECAAEIQTWRRTVQRLENLEWPAPMPRRVTPAPLLKWAIAASIVLCVGFSLGRFTGPNAAQIQAAVKAEVTRDLETKLAALQPKQSATTDLKPILAALAELRDQQSANYISLRKDLETLASTADARIQLATRRLAQLDTQISRDPIQ